LKPAFSDRQLNEQALPRFTPASYHHAPFTADNLNEGMTFRAAVAAGSAQHSGI
jgi:hypothetical protein